MIKLEKGQGIPDDHSLVVFASDGEYADTDLILCAEKRAPGEPTAQLQAQYIKYGPVVYQFNTPEDLGAALFAIDPASTHDAVTLFKEEEARRKAREGGTLEPENPAPAPDSPEETPVPEEGREETDASDSDETVPAADEEQEIVLPTEEPSIDIPDEPGVPETTETVPETPPSEGEVLGASDASVPDGAPAVDLSNTTAE